MNLIGVGERDYVHNVEVLLPWKNAIRHLFGMVYLRNVLRIIINVIIAAKNIMKMGSQVQIIRIRILNASRILPIIFTGDDDCREPKDRLFV